MMATRIRRGWNRIIGAAYAQSGLFLSSPPYPCPGADVSGAPGYLTIVGDLITGLFQERQGVDDSGNLSLVDHG